MILDKYRGFLLVEGLRVEWEKGKEWWGGARWWWWCEVVVVVVEGCRGCAGCLRLIQIKITRQIVHQTNSKLWYI